MRIYKCIVAFSVIFGGVFSFAECPVGDLDGNCSVGVEDLVIFADSWLDDSVSSANFDGLDNVDMSDFSIFSRHWGDVGYRLVINELMADNETTIEDPDEAGEYPDWIELYNYGTTPINIGGMHLTDSLSDPDQWQIPVNAPTQTIIQPGGYLLIWADSDDNNGQGPLHANFNLSASAEEVGLFDSTGKQIDAIAFSGLGNDDSYGRYPNGGLGWQQFDSPTATPGSSNGGESADAGIIINEIMYHPDHDELTFVPEPLGLEYIELFNTGTSAVDLGGWRFVDGLTFEIPAGTIIGGNGYLVIAANESEFSVRYPTVTNVAGGWLGKLSNSGEEVTLVNAIGTIIDSVEYFDEGDWSQRLLGPLDYSHRGWTWSDAHDGSGYSLELICPNQSYEYGQNWNTSTTDGGTPGRVNSVFAADTAPIIQDVSHTPLMPDSSQTVTVTAKLSDETPGPITAILHWRVDTSVYVESTYPTYNPASYTTVAMLDDGQHGDRQPGDGIYGASIPAQTDATVVEFFVEASDSLTNTRTWPKACDVDGTPQQVANLLYQVDDSFATDTAWTAGKQPIYYIIMTEAERGRIEDIGEGNGEDSDAQMNATFISVDGVDSKTRYNVGVRNRGNGSRDNPPNNWRFNFRHDHPWKDVTAINLNSKYTYLQLVGSAIVRLAGLSAAEGTAVQVRVNGENLALTETDPTRMYGTYVHLEAPNSDFASNHFPDDDEGNIYKAAIFPQVADLTYLGTNPADYVARGYTKSTNGSKNDWSDLFELTNVLENEPDATYIERLEQIVDTEQWIRWYAVQALIGNGESNLGTGYGDDYQMYCGVVDRRFKLLAHDLDTILGEGDSWAVEPDQTIWKCIEPNNRVHMVVIERFLQHPEYVWRYYAELKKLTETVFAPVEMDPLLDSLLGGFVPESQLTRMKQWVVDRNSSVLSQIPLTFTAETSLPTVNGYYQTTSSTTAVNGTADATETRSVRVNGLLANWDGVEGTWSLNTGLSLLPGINRVVVQTYGTSDGTGDEMHRGHVDVWYNDGNESTLSGTLAANTVLDAASGPWRVTGDIVIPASLTLTIQPGTTVFFNAGTGITVNGTIVAEGAEFGHIRMTPNPGSATQWDGLRFLDTPAESRLVYLDMEYGDAQGDSIIIDTARVSMNYMTFSSTNDSTPLMELTHPQAIIQNCVFPTIGGHESLHGSGLSGSDYLIFDGCTFGQTTGNKDILDFTGGKRPGPIIQMYNNFFSGGPDDALDFDDTDGHVEGNIFLAFANGYDGNVNYTTANAVATDFGSDVVVARNLFVGGDHHILLKNDVTITSQNNTFVGATMASINFGEPGRGVDPGAGAYLENSIFWDNDRIFFNIFDNPEYPGYGPEPMPSVFNTIIPAQWHSLGTSNIGGAPLFADPSGGDYSLQPGSPAISAGTNGLDMGYQVPAGASISGAPAPVSYSTEATLSVGGPGMVSYRWRLVDDGVPGAWSSAIPLPIAADNYTLGVLSLTGLENGHSYRVDVIGKNSAEHWQGQQFGNTGFFAPGDSEGNSSATWTVDTSSKILIIYEVLASNVTLAHEGTYPDMIELYYDGPTAIDLGGYRLTDNIDVPDKFVFTAGTTMNPGDYLILYADTNGSTSGIHTGFFIDSDGDDIYLLDPAAVAVDSVVFGMQLDDRAIGRFGKERQWALTEPTFGDTNIIAPRGDHRNLKINEWLADGKILFVDDWMEIYNPSPWPVDMGGLFITDDPVAEPNRALICPLSFVDGAGFAVFEADKSDASGHLPFNLSADGEIIAIYDADLNEIDKVIYTPNMTDASQGRTPDGSDSVQFFDLPTPGVSNASVNTTITTDSLIAIEDVWSYEQSGTDLGTAWRDAGYDDSTWPMGSALLYVEDSDLPAAKNTPLTLGETTYYFRKHFTFNGDPNQVDHLDLSTVIDDGAVIYLNGTEVKRIRINGTVTYSTFADSPAVGNAGYEYFTVPADALQNGDNVIAVEVHQVNATSSDVVFGLELDAVSTITVIEDQYTDDRKVMDGLRITEIMYNPAADPNAEFVELQNISDMTIDLDGVRFTRGVDFIFPAMTLDPGEYTVVVARQDVFEARYGTALNVAGEYAGKLDNGGEEIILRLADPLDAAIMRFEYKDGWYPATDGGGHSLVIDDPTAEPKSWCDEENWRQSVVAGGSPCSDDIALVVISEVLSHSHDTLPDWIEVYNASDTTADIGGWYLSDDADNLKKYQIADGTTIDPGNYMVFYENLHFGGQFALSENGETVYLSSGQGGVLTGYVVEVSFGASETGVSFGLYEKSDQTTVFVSMSSVTPNTANFGPKVGDVVISEIMYNPPSISGAAYPDQDYEYIELHNITSSPVTLEYYDPETFETLGWKFTSGVDYTFPLGTTIPVNGYLIVAKNPAAFTEKHGTVGAAVLGPFENGTNLSNGGELLELSMPGDTDLLETRYFIHVDSVHYDDEDLWPAAPDGGGPVLDRIDDTLYGDDVVNWQSQSANPGS